MDSDGDDGQVEVVKHDRKVMVQAVLRVEMKTQRPTADDRH